MKILFIKYLSKLFNFDYQTRILPRKILKSPKEAYDYINEVHNCWGGGELDINLYYDLKNSMTNRYISQPEFWELKKKLGF